MVAPDEFYYRAIKGLKTEEKQFDVHILPRKLKELTKKHDIRKSPEEAVPQDLDMARRVFRAAVELLTNVGIYCTSTNTLLPITEEEINEALRNAPNSYIIGEGEQAVECYSRGIHDEKVPRVIGGACGTPLSEDRFSDILLSYAAEEIDGLHTGTIQTYDGEGVIAATPIELLACRNEALRAREVVRRAGKPGMALLGVMSGINSESQSAGDFPNGFRPSDIHLITFENELKIDWNNLKLIIHNHNFDNIIDACTVPVLGGYAGGPEGTAIVAVAEAIQGYIIANPKTFSLGITTVWANRQHLDSRHIWVSSMLPLAFIAAELDLCLGVYTGGSSGPCTEMLCYEIAADAVAFTAAGFSILKGASACTAGKENRATGMESRILVETSRAVAGLGLSDANRIVKEIEEKSRREVAEGEMAPLGESFAECYDKDLNPSEEYMLLWKRKKKEFEELGIGWIGD